MEDKGLSKKLPDRSLTWKGNMLVFLLLFAGVVLYFSYQIQQARDVFITDAKAHAKLAADIIGLSAKSAVASSEVIDAILQVFLSNTTRFIEYLDSVEPLSGPELEAFSLESGLSGSMIVRNNGVFVSGPSDWLLKKPDICNESEGLTPGPAPGEIIFINKTGEKSCIIAGVRSEKIMRLKKEIGIKATIDKISKLPEISYVRIEKNNELNGQMEKAHARIIKTPEGQVAEIRMDFGNNILFVALNAMPLQKNIRKLWMDLFFFSIILAISGAVLSWLIYRQHMIHVKQVEVIERKLYHQREEASLGRAAAAIAHEVRNPLNAISIGLQRLKFELSDLTPEHESLIQVIQDSLRRANGIVTDLVKFARIPSPKPVRISIEEIVGKNLLPYKKKMEQMDIRLEINKKGNGIILADPNLLSHVFDNLIKNAMEAQPKGGFLSISIEDNGKDVAVHFENTGMIPTPESRKNLLEPYFTTKTRGIGLGLAICNRIIKAHEGKMAISFPQQDIIRISVVLPKKEKMTEDRQ